MSVHKIALRINVCADDWTPERAIIASNVYSQEVCLNHALLEICECQGHPTAHWNNVPAVPNIKYNCAILFSDLSIPYLCF